MKRKRKDDSRVDIQLNAIPIGPAPVRAHRSFNRPSAGVLELDEISNTLRAFADEADTSFVANTRSGNRLLRSINAGNDVNVNKECPWTPEPNCTIADIYHTKYRSIDGSCNNLHSPMARNQGKKNTPFVRILPSAYSGMNIE